FPSKTIAPEVGDIVMFPSSVFHRTIPFNSDEERICIAFDLKPA
ncbi:putative 2OG-Fe(II) oxygenase, partial [Methylophaga sp. UBA3595]